MKRNNKKQELEAAIIELKKLDLSDEEISGIVGGDSDFSYHYYTPNDLSPEEKKLLQSFRGLPPKKHAGPDTKKITFPGHKNS